jgi:hypothetical protein
MVCPHCGGIWTDAERARNSREAERTLRLEATAPFNGLAGFYISDLMSSSPARRCRRRWRSTCRRSTARPRATSPASSNSRTTSWAWRSSTSRRSEAGGARAARRGLRRADRAVGRPACSPPASTCRAIASRSWSWPGAAARNRGACTGARSTATRSTSRRRLDDLEHMLFRPYRHASGASCTSRRVDRLRRRQHVRRRVRVLPQAPPPRRDGDQGPRGRRDLPRAAADRPGPPHQGLEATACMVYQVGTEKAKDLLIGFGEHGGRLRLSEQRRKTRSSPAGPGTHALVPRDPRRLLPAGHLRDQGAEAGAPRTSSTGSRSPARATRRSTARCTRCTPRARCAVNL